jgi:drug/metabolite transporter (DMT)-like permease
MKDNRKVKGILSGLASAVLLGLSPIFGKLSINNGFTPLFLVAFRSGTAALMLFFVVIAFRRKLLYIYPLGLVGCGLAGIFNGIGSILYYFAISRLEASIGQLIYSFYPLFVAFWLLLDRQPISWMTFVRLLISVPGIYLLLSVNNSRVDILSVCMMLGAAIFYALHLIINQRVLFEVPAPTVAFYTMFSMFIITLIAFLLFDRQIPSFQIPWWPIIGMALIVFTSRLTLFLGVKHLGGLQTSLLGLGELLTTLIIANLWLGERLSTFQWIGAAMLGLSMFLVGFDKPTKNKRHSKGWFAWLSPSEVSVTDIP